MEINFSNYKNFKTSRTEDLTVNGADGTSPAGINIFSQRFNRSEAEGEVASIDKSAILAVISKVVKVDAGSLLVFPDESTPIESIVMDTSDVDGNTYTMAKNQVLVFKSKQGPLNLKYTTLYCYLRDNNGEFWIIYIQNVSTRIPVVFKVQDQFVPKFVLDNGKQPDGDGTSPYIVAIETGNFTWEKTTSKWPDDISLKNTTFNLAVDDNTEGMASLVYLGNILVQSK